MVFIPLSFNYIFPTFIGTMKQVNSKNRSLNNEEVSLLEKKIEGYLTELQRLHTRIDEMAATIASLQNPAESSEVKIPSLIANPLSGREQEVLTYVAKGYSDKDIAAIMHLSVNTVKTHLRRIFNKLEVKNRTEAIIKVN